MVLRKKDTPYLTLFLLDIIYLIIAYNLNYFAAGLGVSRFGLIGISLMLHTSFIELILFEFINLNLKWLILRFIAFVIITYLVGSLLFQVFTLLNVLILLFPLVSFCLRLVFTKIKKGNVFLVLSSSGLFSIKNDKEGKYNGYDFIFSIVYYILIILWSIMTFIYLDTDNV